MAEEIRAYVPPAPPKDPAKTAAERKTLALHMQKQEINTAFQKALDACDLDLVTFLLSKADPKVSRGGFWEEGCRV